MFISGGAAAPMFTTPRDISSKEAPIIRPFSISPSTIPTKVLTISGLSKFNLPKSLESKIQNTPIRLNKIDCTNNDIL